MAELRLPADLPLSLPSRLVDQRPDIRAAEANLHAASAQIGVAKAARLPNITLSGIMGGTSGRLTDLLAPQNNFWDLTAGVTQPVFDGGALKHRQRAAEAAYDQAAAQYRSTVNVAFQNVADTLHSLDQDSAALALSAQSYQASERGARLARQQFDAGEVNAQALRTAEQARLAAAGVLAQNQGARYADTVALFAALGGGWWNRNDTPGAETPSKGR
jgi:NodT family efflux transporter outer membrane factor (OMF) lipoprotein